MISIFLNAQTPHTSVFVMHSNKPVDMVTVDGVA